MTSQVHGHTSINFLVSRQRVTVTQTCKYQLIVENSQKFKEFIKEVLTRVCRILLWLFQRRGAHPVACVADTLYRSTMPGAPVQRRLPILAHPGIGVPLHQLC